MEKTIIASRPLVDCLYREVKSWLSGRDETVAKIKILQTNARDVHHHGVTVRRITAAGTAVVSVIAGIATFGIAVPFVLAAGAVGLVASGVQEKHDGENILTSVQCVINKDKERSEKVNTAFKELKEYCTKVRESEELHLINVEVKKLFVFFLDCYLCSEEDIPDLVKAAEKMRAYIPEDDAELVPDLNGIAEYANYVVDIIILAIDIFDLLTEKSSVETTLEKMCDKLKKERRELRNLVHYLEKSHRRRLVVSIEQSRDYVGKLREAILELGGAHARLVERLSKLKVYSGDNVGKLREANILFRRHYPPIHPRLQLLETTPVSTHFRTFHASVLSYSRHNVEELHIANIRGERPHPTLVRRSQHPAILVLAQQFTELHSKLGYYCRCVSNLNRVTRELYYFSKKACIGIDREGCAGFLSPTTIFFTCMSCFRLSKDAVREAIVQNHVQDCCKISCYLCPYLPDMKYKGRFFPEDITQDELNSDATTIPDGSYCLDRNRLDKLSSKLDKHANIFKKWQASADYLSQNIPLEKINIPPLVDTNMVKAYEQDC